MGIYTCNQISINRLRLPVLLSVDVLTVPYIIYVQIFYLAISFLSKRSSNKVNLLLHLFTTKQKCIIFMYIIKERTLQMEY